MLKNKLRILFWVNIMGVFLLGIGGCSNSNINILEKENRELELQLGEKDKEIIGLRKIAAEKSLSIKQLEQTVKDLDSRIKETEEDEGTYYGSYLWVDNFLELINDNPIDKDYEIEFDELQNSEEFSTAGWLALEIKYTRFWEAEMNNAYSHLLEILESEHRENLIASQKSWLEHVAYDFTFVWDKFIATGHFGSQGKVQIQRVCHKKAKERTIELMEYIYSLEHEANFIYDNQ